MKTPRDYQVDAYNAVVNQLRAVSSTLVVMATGTGKTIVMARLATEWSGNVLLLAERINLLDQAQEKFACELEFKPPIIQGQRGCEFADDAMFDISTARVAIGSVQTLRNPKRWRAFENWKIDLILIDECHHARSKSYRTIIDRAIEANPDCKIVGVTATPRRGDNKALGLVFETLAYELNIVAACDAGWLVPIRQKICIVGDVDFSKLDTAKNSVGESDFDASQLEELLLDDKPLYGMAKPILEVSDGRKGIVFTAGVLHAHRMAEVLNALAGKKVAVAIDGTTPINVRNAAYADFQEGDLQFLTNCNVLTEGFDAPAASFIAMAKPTRSLSAYLQQLGRGTRPLPGIVDGVATPEARRDAIAASLKPDMLVLDFVGNSEHADSIVTAPDALGGDYDDAEMKMAKEALARGSQRTVAEELRGAKIALAFMAEQRRRVEANVDYMIQDVEDTFAKPVVGKIASRHGGASEKQIEALVNLGVSHDTAYGMNKKQAGVVMQKLRDQRCSAPQMKILSRFGESTKVNFYEAKIIIDEIAGNGWKRREKA